jgi:hypothetical protein
MGRIVVNPPAWLKASLARETPATKSLPDN